MFISCSFHVHFMFISCSFHVHFMFISCSFHVHFMFISCSFHVHFMFISCSFHVHLGCYLRQTCFVSRVKYIERTHKSVPRRGVTGRQRGGGCPGKLVLLAVHSDQISKIWQKNTKYVQTLVLSWKIMKEAPWSTEVQEEGWFIRKNLCLSHFQPTSHFHGPRFVSGSTLAERGTCRELSNGAFQSFQAGSVCSYLTLMQAFHSFSRCVLGITWNNGKLPSWSANKNNLE